MRMLNSVYGFKVVSITANRALRVMKSFLPKYVNQNMIDIDQLLRICTCVTVGRKQTNLRNISIFSS